MRWKIGVAIVLAGAGLAHAQIQYVSQTRSVSAATQAGTESYTFAGVGPWGSSASSDYPLGQVYSSASQTSDLRTDAISFALSAQNHYHNGYPVSSSSSLNVTFSLAVATPYELVMQSLYVSSSLTLARGSTVIFQHSSSTTQAPLDVVGTLQAGSYQMTVQSEGAVALGASSVDATLYIPSPASAGVLLLGPIALGLRRRAGGEGRVRHSNATSRLA